MNEIYQREQPEQSKDMSPVVVETMALLEYSSMEALVAAAQLKGSVEIYAVTDGEVKPAMSTENRVRAHFGEITMKDAMGL